MKIKSLLWSLLAMVMAVSLSYSFTSCGSDEEEDEVSVAMPSVMFEKDGGSSVVPITCNTSWTVTGNPAWLTVMPSSGKGNGTISLMAQKNTDKNSRNCVLYISAGKASATIAVNQAGKGVSNQICVTNNSTYTLERFRVVFMNARLEELTDRDFGTLAPGTTIYADIPTAATEYYMATYLGKWYFSANYSVEYTDMVLTTAEVGNWSANSSRSQYPKAEEK